MSGFMTGLLLALAFIGMFIITFAILEKKGLLKAYNLEMSGPFLFWKTQRGKDLIDKLSEKERFWKIYGNISVVIVSICMVLMLALVVWSAYLASFIPAESAPSPRMIIGIPGVNPIIPIWYGILGLAIAIIVHEFSHGILARLAKVKVKTLGLVFLVVPIGAFVEPDEEEMEELTKIKRDRIYGAGPTSNIVLALVFAILFSSVFMASVTPRENGMMVHGIMADSPADISGLELGELILSIDNIRTEEYEDILHIDVEPFSEVSVTTRWKDMEREYNVISGLVITFTQPDSPAHGSGLQKLDIIVSMDEEVIRNYHDFDEFLNDKSAGEELYITYARKDNDIYNLFNTTLTLADKYESFAESNPSENREEFRGQGYMGVSLMYMGINLRDVRWIPQLMARPFQGAETPNDYLMASLTYISLPFLRLSPLPTEFTQLYQVTGPLAHLPSGVFWALTNALYWIFWLNLMVGLFNALPAVPLDGGYIFKDGVTSLVEKFKLNKSTEERVVHSISYLLAFIILGLLLWQLIGPHI